MLALVHRAPFAALAALFALTVLARPRPAAPAIVPPPTRLTITVMFVGDPHMVFAPPSTNDPCVIVPAGL